MVTPYAFIRLAEGKKAFAIKRDFRTPKEHAEFLMEEGNMVGYYLGACLDSCRWGSMTTVMYEMSNREMIGFVQNWMEQNKGNFQNLFHEKKIDELFERFELPFIDHKVCPRASEDNKHHGTMMDLGGKVRCAHRTERMYKPNFVESYINFDKEANMNRILFLNDEPHNSVPDDYDEDDEYWKKEEEEYERELEKFNEEEPTLKVIDLCYAILSDEGNILSLEEIIRRLNLRPEFVTVYCPDDTGSSIAGIGRKCTSERIAEMSEEEKKDYEDIGRCPGHPKHNDKIEFPFDGWTLAFYVQKWWEQLPDGKAPWFGKEVILS